MKQLFVIVFTFAFKLSSYGQDPVSLASRVVLGDPSLYQTWIVDGDASTITDALHGFKSIKFIFDNAALKAFESSLPPSRQFYDADVFPLEINTITHYGKAEFESMDGEKMTMLFLVNKFGSYQSLIVTAVDHAARITFDKNTLALKFQYNQLVFKPQKNPSATVTPKRHLGIAAVANDANTSWLENGLLDRVKQTTTKQYELEYDADLKDYRNRGAVGLVIEKYNEDGLLTETIQTERGAYFKTTATGSWKNSKITEFRSNQDLTIESALTFENNFATIISKVNGAFLIKTVKEFSDGRLVQIQEINHLNEVQKILTLHYNPNGRIVSKKLAYANQDLVSEETFDYQNFDGKSNWTERIVSRGGTPYLFEVRVVEYVTTRR